MTWTLERDAILTADWQSGVSSIETARKLDVTKSAVIGRAHRLNLGPHPSGNGCLWSEDEDHVLIRARDHEHMSFPEIADLLPGRTENQCRLRYDRLQKGQSGVERPGLPLAYTDTGGCLFAISPHDAKPHEHRFCNEPSVPGTSWCMTHARMIGMSRADLDRLKEKQEDRKARADARRARTAIDFAPHYTAKRQDNGGIAI